MDNKNLPDLYNQQSWGARINSFSGILRNFLGLGSWNPIINLRENVEEIMISAEIPGIDPRDLDVVVKGNKVILKGSSHREETREQQGYSFSAKSLCGFYQEVPLPERVKSESTVARYQDGVLELKMKKGKSMINSFRPQVTPRD